MPPEPALVLRALVSPASRFIEDRCAVPSSRMALGLAMRTRTAYQFPIAQIFTLALRERASLCDAVAENVELALHEAVANAIVHGNLGIGSEERNSLEGFGRFCREVVMRLADPAAAARPVVLTAWWSDRWLLVGVRDQGRGFVLGSDRDTGEAAHGRGIHFMHELAERVSWNQRHRRLVLTFRQPKGL